MAFGIVGLSRARTLAYIIYYARAWDEGYVTCFATLMYQNPNTHQKKSEIFGQFTKKQYLCIRFRAQRKRATNDCEIAEKCNAENQPLTKKSKKILKKVA